ncbi:DUF6443 domain-containing protein [Chitinophaga horti]|uniref:DUF6443 domain-containing protein n=1 Tax=Chitinophaga horti TaxID=2920382 RepID=A0ABY6J750_9BACT|nr:DUF6443 domain-containing protein [Chitinophaga horti]UYQ95513.1 DUF6443 domain-containing protein [Chitinophaga horti]
MKFINILFVVLLCCASVKAQKPVVQTVPAPTRSAGQLPATPSAYPAGIRVNYVRTFEPSKPYTVSASVIAATDVADVKQSTQYLDGLGRPLQTVVKGGAPGKKDLVAPVVYDPYGREEYKYLPYAASGGNGAFRMNPFAGVDSFAQLQYPGESVFFSETQFEPSPLNRPLKQMAAGNSWAGSNRGVGQQYLVNTAADDVRSWDIALADDSYPSSTSAYATGSLFKHITTDEAGNKVVEFQDKSGLIILKKVQIDATPADNHTGWLSTYYVYDQLNRLRFVIPPKAVADMVKANSWSLADPVFRKQLCFRYEYDARNRMRLKQVPGADPVYLVYDIRDRLVFTQDGNLKFAGKWLVTFYDEQNRSVMTALYTSSQTAAALQLVMNSATGSQTITSQVKVPSSLAVDAHDGRAVYQAGTEIVFGDGFDTGIGAETETLLDPNAIATTETIVASLAPVLPSAQLEPLTYTYYDNYAYAGAKASQAVTLSADAADNPDVQPTALAVKGIITGTKVKLLDGSNQWLVTTSYYDSKGRIKQVLADNAASGTEVLTTLYDFSNRPLRSQLFHHNPRSAVATRDTLLTMYAYDHAGRVASMRKKLNTGPLVEIAANEYDNAGQLNKKTFKKSSGSFLESLDYHYNIRGWLTGINKDYANGSGTHFFGQELNYNYGFEAVQYNGNITGTKWRGAGGERRAYGFTYDRSNRLMSAEFNQLTGGAWNKSANINYDIKMGDGLHHDSAYDANGNILRMQQWGYSGGASSQIDDLRYTYIGGGNKLAGVKDAFNNATSTLGDFKELITGGLNDYAYDSSGNMIGDGNKGISDILYNHLNLPDKVAMDGKGVIKYVYDAAGVKHAKLVLDSTGGVVRHHRTDYISGMVYENDTLRLVSHEEGRIRADYTGGTRSFIYDYFVKDHLGSVRQVLTEATTQGLYLATMETAAAPLENALFSNIDATRNAAPVGYGEQKSTFVSRLNGKDPARRIGPSLVLKVMPGDTISLGARAFYKSMAPKDPGKQVTGRDMAAALLSAFAGAPGSTGEHAGGTGAEGRSPFSGQFYDGQYQRLKDKDAESRKSLTRPKAYLNYVLFNDQFKLVEENSGTKQVKETPDEVQVLAHDKMVIKESGFLYVYASNEAPQDVYFDDVVVMMASGPVLEETHYYPFGLTMSGISTKALGPLENRYLYNGKELQSKEFSTGGLGWYDYGARMMDPQIGRWHVIDPLAEFAESLTPFRYGYNNPISFIDNLGLSEGWYGDSTGATVFSPTVNSQKDLTDQGISGTYLGQEGYGIDESSGYINHYNSDGTITQGAVTLSGVTVSPGLIGGFPAEMVLKARGYNYYKGSWNAFQDGVRSQERSFKFINNYFAPVVTTVAGGGLQGMGAAGVTRALTGTVVWTAGTSNSTMIAAANVNASIKALNMTNAAAGKFFGWGSGVNTKTAADFTVQSLKDAGITKSALEALAKAYYQVAQYSSNNPSAYIRYQQLSEILTLFN